MSAAPLQDLHQLIDASIERGLLYEDELLDSLLAADVPPEDAEEIRQDIERRGVLVISSASPDTSHDPTETDPSAADSLDHLLAAIWDRRLLTKQQEQTLARRIERGDESARRLLIESNLRLVVSIAKRYGGRGVPMADLVQEGALGLIRAVDKFDWRRDLRFSTYAGWWIRSFVQRSASDYPRSIRFPSNVSDSARRVEGIRRRIERAEGVLPADERVADEVGTQVERVRALRRLPRVVTSVDAWVDEDGSPRPHAHVSTDPAPEQIVEALLRYRDIAAALAALPPAARMVVDLYFGLSDSFEHSTRTIARRMRMSEREVSTILSDALAALAADIRLRDWRGGDTFANTGLHQDSVIRRGDPG